MSPTANYNPILIAEEVSELLEREGTLRERLDAVVTYLKEAMRVDVCSLYRKSGKTGDLYLEATDGLDRASLGLRALASGEGLTGIVVDTRKPLAVRDGPSHPNYKYVVGIREEQFHSYLGVAVTSGQRVIGALVVQTRAARDFSREEIALLNTLARPIGSVVAASFRKRDEAGPTDQPTPDAPDPRATIITGRMMAPGCFTGEPNLFDQGLNLATIYTPPARGIAEELKAVRRASGRVGREVERDARAISGSSDGYAILLAHKMILKDEETTREIVALIEGGASAAEAIRATALRWIHLLEKQPDPSFAARATDFRDIANRMLHSLGVKTIRAGLTQGRIVAVARTLLPGDLLRLGPRRIGAIVMTHQGIHSHTSILARSFGIPAVQVAEQELERLMNSKRLLVDGSEGLVLLDPEPKVAERYAERARVLGTLPEGGPEDLRGPARTSDGTEISLGLNAGLFSDFDSIDTHGPDEIGLYRTEIPFMSGRTFPGLKAQTAHYEMIIDLAGGRRATIRTFDIGGDKIPEAIRFGHEENPMMGFRSTRYMLAHTGLLRVQLRAILTASARGPLAILFPMISTPEELNLALDELNTVKNELERAGVKFDPNIPVGVMIEVPGAMFAVEELAKSADFFSVGSNDLIQYLMAADRSNPSVGWLYQWYHPSVLNALDFLMKQCRRADRPVTICGEISAHPWAALILIGLGFRRLSLDSHAIGLIKWTLMQASMETMRALAKATMSASSSTEVIEILYQYLPEFETTTPPLGKALAASLERLRRSATW